jgi:uncharacterized membrane protein YkvA (DUF1232 family)
MTIFRLLGTVRSSLPAALPLLRHPRVPGWLKLGAIGAALLIVSPLDPFADIPVLGMLDDALLLALLVSGFVAVGLRFAAEPAPVTRAAASALPGHVRTRNVPRR